MDKSIIIILRAISKKLISRVVSLERPKLTSRIAEIRKRHDASLKMSSESVVEIKDKVSWAVMSSKATDSFLYTYEVTYLAKCSCEIKCHDCNICIHELSCTCNDYSIRFLICKHIHLVCKNFQFGFSSSSLMADNDDDQLMIDVNDRDIDREEEKQAITKQVKKYAEERNLEEEKAELNAEFQEILKRYKNIKQLRGLKDFISMEKAKLFQVNEANCSFPEVPTQFLKQPATTNIEPQRRFQSVKAAKKRKLSE